MVIDSSGDCRTPRHQEDAEPQRPGEAGRLHVGGVHRPLKSHSGGFNSLAGCRWETGYRAAGMCVCVSMWHDPNYVSKCALSVDTCLHSQAWERCSH